MVISDLVSVIIPTYNRSRFLARAINSALAQTYRSIEIIVVDDGSTDNTEAVLAAYGDQIIVVRQGNQGVSAARNTGLRIAKGEYVAFLDSDDFWAREKLSEQVATLHVYPEADVCYTWWVMVDSNGCFRRALHPSAEGDVFPELYFSNFLFTSQILARRTCFTKNGELDLCFDSDLVVAEDWKMWLQLSLRHRFCCVPKYLMYYTEHSGSAIHSNQASRLVVCLRSVEAYLWQEPRAVDWLRRWGARARAAWQVKVAYMLFNKGRRTDALTGFIRALRICPTYLPIYTGMAQCLVGRRPVECMIHIYNAWRYPEPRSAVPQFELSPMPMEFE